MKRLDGDLASGLQDKLAPFLVGSRCSSPGHGACSDTQLLLRCYYSVSGFAGHWRPSRMARPTYLFPPLQFLGSRFFSNRVASPCKHPSLWMCLVNHTLSLAPATPNRKAPAHLFCFIPLRACVTPPPSSFLVLEELQHQARALLLIPNITMTSGQLSSGF